MRLILSRLLRLVVGLWIRCLRTTRIGPPVTGPGIVAFWHGDQLALLGQRPGGPLVAPISMSADGSLQADVMAGFGIQAVRGSSHRGALTALRGLMRALRCDELCLIAVDGSRGPRHQAKSGAIYLAQRAKCPIWVVGVAVERSTRLKRSWDQFLLPFPGTRTVVVFEQPWWPPPDVDPRSLTRELTDRLHRAHAQAAQMLPGA